MTRYADDLVIQCRTREEAERLGGGASVDDPSGPDAASHEDQNRGCRDRRLRLSGLSVREASPLRAPEEPDEVPRYHPRENTTDSRGRGLNVIIAACNRTLRGWFEYFKHSHRTTFPYLDGWIRMRLRCILRKRHGQKGRGISPIILRWPNAYFAGQGLFSLAKAHVLACQSSRR